MANDPAVKPRSAAVIRTEREAANAQIENLRVATKRLSDELRAVEGPIPDRSGRPAKEAGLTIKPA